MICRSSCGIAKDDWIDRVVFSQRDKFIRDCCDLKVGRLGALLNPAGQTDI